MASRFDRVLDRVLNHEGGYVDHPSDPGGATNFGITRRKLAEWRGIPMRDLPKSEVRKLTRAEAKEIYKSAYWDAIRGDDLPAGLDYAVFDFAVNSGPARAAKFLQRILGVGVDGIIGGITLRAIEREAALSLVIRLIDDRLAYLQGLKTWRIFGDGWSTRLAKVLAGARADIERAGP